LSSFSLFEKLNPFTVCPFNILEFIISKFKISSITC
jgi:hypothetical protein